MKLDAAIVILQGDIPCSDIPRYKEWEKQSNDVDDMPREERHAVIKNAIRILESWPKIERVIEAAKKFGDDNSYFEGASDVIEWIDGWVARLRFQFRKPTHGNCCTCQTCGHPHDECLCCEINKFQELRALVEAIMKGEG